MINKLTKQKLPGQSSRGVRRLQHSLDSLSHHGREAFLSVMWNLSRSPQLCDLLQPGLPSRQQLHTYTTLPGPEPFLQLHRGPHRLTALQQPLKYMRNLTLPKLRAKLLQPFVHLSPKELLHHRTEHIDLNLAPISNC